MASAEVRMPPAGVPELFTDVKRAALRGLAILVFPWFVIAAAGVIGTPLAVRVALVVMPLTILVMCGSVGWRLIRRNRLALLTPLPLAFALGALVFGFGPMLYVLQPNSSYATANFRIVMDLAGLYHVQLLNLVGFTLLLAGLAAASGAGLRLGVFRPAERSGAVPVDGEAVAGLASFGERSLFRAYASFTAVAIVVRTTERIGGIDLLDLLPSFFSFLDGMGALAVFIGSVLAVRRGGWYWLLPLLPLVVEVIDGFLALRKSKILTPVLFAFLGAYLAGRPIRSLISGVLICITLFVLIYPVINAGRRVAWLDGGATSTEFFATGLAGDSRVEVDALDVWSAWARWNYTPIQFGLMREYNSGRSGTTFSDLPWMFVPRFVAPEKPVLDFGARVNELLLGHRRSASGSTIFGEAYWNGGWPLTVLVAFLSGVLLLVNSAVCIHLFSHRSLLTWPVAFTGILTGQLLQNFFTVGLLGMSIAFLLLALLLSALYAVGMTPPPPARAPVPSAAG